ncbi:hypothetical protein ABQF34_14910 [Mycolicibacterium boenickei]
MSPPVAAAVNGTATAWIAAWTSSPLNGRTWSTIPSSTCGVNRLSVAAAVNASAPRAPIEKPSSDSRVLGPASRTTTTGTIISSMAPNGTPRPSRTIRNWSTPPPIGMSYSRATAAPVTSTHPVPSPTPTATVNSSVSAERY